MNALHRFDVTSRCFMPLGHLLQGEYRDPSLNTHPELRVRWVGVFLWLCLQ